MLCTLYRSNETTDDCRQVPYETDCLVASFPCTSVLQISLDYNINDHKNHQQKTEQENSTSVYSFSLSGRGGFKKYAVHIKNNYCVFVFFKSHLCTILCQYHETG